MKTPNRNQTVHETVQYGLTAWAPAVRSAVGRDARWEEGGAPKFNQPYIFYFYCGSPTVPNASPLLHIFALMLNQLVKGRFDGSAAKPQWTVANDDGGSGTVTIEPDDSGVPSDRSIEIDYTRENVWIRSVFWDGMEKKDFDGKKLWDGMEDATIFRIDCAFFYL